MKLLHTSDWHLGMTFRGGITYEEDQRFMVNAICEVAQKEGADAILLAGDVFDKSIASQEALKLYDELMTKICGELRIPVLLIAGNHDGAERISQCYRLLKSSGLHIAGALQDKPQIVTLGDVDVYLLPWISTDKVGAIYPSEKEKIHSMEDAYRVVLDKYREQFVPGHKNILVAHAYIVNAQTSVSDRSAEIGKAAMISSSVFDGFDYVALGHLHGPQEVNKHVRYSGSPMAYSFGKEEKQKKSVVIVDTDTWEQRIAELPQRLKRTTIPGTLDELMAADYEKEIRDGYVRLEVTDKFVGMDTMALLRERYPNLLEVQSPKDDQEDGTITMTVDELEEQNADPEAVFKKYCEDVIKEAPSERLCRLFRKAVESYEGRTEA